MLNFIKHSLFIIALLPALAAPALAMTPDELADNLQASYDRAADLKAEFTQVSEVKSMRIVREGAGNLVIKKPGMLRYTYTRPDKQEIIVRDGELTMYMPESKQAVRRSLDRAMLDKTPSTFLAGLGKITDSFHVRYPETGARDGSGNHLLELLPKGNGMGIKSVTLTIKPDTYEMLGFSFTEVSGNTNTIRLKNIKTNTGIKDSMFEFDIPKGTKLIAE